ncbi:hypothetical protein [Nannocystis sp.]|uniref:hypothetical protein n=1 Tax=Nannocystis sp. TaxID=1962667 RepID=UPI0025F3713D|nr:hypothetical protein [Nannocystis sp.]MBK7824376.1 hypothetical protein [Nannocystis sp.]
MTNQNQNWIFGTNARLDFSTNPPTALALSGNSIDTSEGCASISDANGNLLMYTDGCKLWNGANEVQSSALLGDASSTQSAIIVPDPGNSKRYYVLTMDGSTNTDAPYNHFNGVRVDVTNPGTWVITPLSDLMTLPSTEGFSPAEKLTAVPHRNCTDTWVVTILQAGKLEAMDGIGTFRVFLINAAGITWVADTSMRIAVYEVGYLRGSPDGSMLAVANAPTNSVRIYPFDNTTGAININISLQRETSTPTEPEEIVRRVYGVEFSPDSKVLYFGNLSYSTTEGGSAAAQTGHVFQVDLTPAVLPAPTLVGSVLNGGGLYAIGALQRGIDGRIYIAKDGESSLAAILNPNVLGAGCNFTDNYIVLPTTAVSRLGLPNIFPNPCDETGDCGCGCHGCNEDAEVQNEELIDRAKAKSFTQTQAQNCKKPFDPSSIQAIPAGLSLAPCFHFHWGDGANDQIEEHDTEVFYLTVCNPFNDLQYNGLRITKVTLIPDIHPLSSIQIVPDRFVVFDCLEACTCQTREFAMITRAANTAGDYKLHVDYCFESISLAKRSTHGHVEFDVRITED